MKHKWQGQIIQGLSWAFELIDFNMVYLCKFLKETLLWMVVFLNDGLQMNPESQFYAQKISFIALKTASNIHVTYVL